MRIRKKEILDARTRQPYGILHGGVSVVLAETLGSCGAYYSAPEGHDGLELTTHNRGEEA